LVLQAEWVNDEWIIELLVTEHNGEFQDSCSKDRLACGVRACGLTVCEAVVKLSMADVARIASRPAFPIGGCSNARMLDARIDSDMSLITYPVFIRNFIDSRRMFYMLEPKPRRFLKWITLVIGLNETRTLGRIRSGGGSSLRSGVGRRGR